MSKKLLFLSLLFLFINTELNAQTILPGDELVYGPMFSPVYNNKVRVWVLTKNNVGTGNTLSLSVTGATAPTAQLSGQVYNSDTRLGYSLRSYEYTALTPGDTYTAQLLVNGVATPRVSVIKNEYQIIDDFEFLSGGCGRIYDLSRCIDQPESLFHVNGDPAIFNHMATENSDLMVWLGDAVYLLGLEHANGQCPNGVDDWANKDMAFDRYRFFRGYHDKLTQAMPQLSITDNHDIGSNEFNKNMPTIGQTREVFMDWWPNPEYKSTIEGQGLFSSYVYKDVEYFLTDNRSYRDGTTQHFGPEQLAWLKQGLLNSTATFKVIINGTPTFTPLGGRNFSSSVQAPDLLAYIKNNNINGVLSLSADRHTQEFFVRDGDTKYPLYDVVSGNINSDVSTEPNIIQYDSNLILKGGQHTYLRVNVYGEVDDRRMKIEYVNPNGQAYFEEIVHEDMLTSQNSDAYKLGLNIHNNVVDASTYTHPITATNYTFTPDRDNVANEAIVFNTTTSVEMPSVNALNFHNRPFSLTLWIKPTSFNATGSTLLSNGQAGAGVSFGISPQGKLTFTDHGAAITRESNTSVLLNTWAFITWKYDNVKRKLMLYYNGSLIQTWTNVISPVVSNGTVKVGNNFENKPYIGLLDDLQLYGRLISDLDIENAADIENSRGQVLKVNSSQMVIPGSVINPILNGNYTIEFWGKLNTDPGTNYKILASNGRINNNTTGISFEFPNSNKLNVVLGTNGSGWNTLSEQGQTWNIGEWNHIAVVVSNTAGTIRYYQNGILVGSGNFSGYVPNTWGLGIGYSPFYPGTEVQGEIDELRIWQRTFTAQEIVAHMHYPLVGTESNLAIYYDFTALTDTDTNVVSKGTVNHTIALNGAQLAISTSPVGNIGVDYQQLVTGKWSKFNTANNTGLTFPTAITAYNSNIVAGKKTDTALEPVPGLSGKFYANGGWKIDPLNTPFATVNINLSEALTTNAATVAATASQYYLIRKDEVTNEYVSVATGVYDGTNVVFSNANLSEGFYYLAWENALSIEPIENNKNAIRLYPNPTSGLINIVLNNQYAGENVTVNVFDVLGRNILMFDKLQTTNGNPIQLDLSTAIGGNTMLLVNVKVNNETQQFKVLVTK